MFDLQSLPLAPVLDRIALLSFRLVKALSQIPSAAVSAHSPTIAEIICYYMALIIMYKFKSHIRLKGIPILLVLLLYLVRPYVLNDEFSITFLDVGQGESTVVQLPGKKVMLIDGGTEKPDSGRMVIAPFLRSKGLRTIDYVVISHAHPDHYGGLKYIIDNFKKFYDV